MKSATDKHFRCTICQRGFTRIDHLKRHHLRHSGLKPYSCVFCNEAFARCDNLRDHYFDCPQRGDRKIPETGQRGRRRHACQSCTSMKLRCDGQSPCGSCQKRGLDCNNERKHHANGNEFLMGSLSTPREDCDPVSDRGSIKFLLNGGTDGFTEQFHLPPRGDRARGLAFHNQSRIGDGSQAILSYPVQTDGSDYPPLMMESDPSSLSFYQDNFMNLFNGPFIESHKAMEDSYAGGMAGRRILPPGQDPSLNLTIPGEAPSFEPEQLFAGTLVQAILRRAWPLLPDAKAQDELSTNLNFLLTTARIRKFVGLYFKHWHPSCSIIYPHTFDPAHVTPELLTSVVFMGAVYSTDQREMYVVKRLLDFAELFVFSSEVFSTDHEIAASFSGSRPLEDEANDWDVFQKFLAGFLMVPVQYWSGALVGHDRAMETRFNEVVKVARRTGIFKARHLPQDAAHEYLWIQQESRIRLANIISLMDCAFSFFQNYPCRLSYNELECELPCEESIFNSPQPFSEPNFRFSRDVIVREAFRDLFETSPCGDGSLERGQVHSAGFTNPMQFTVLDMFIMIHLIYALINAHISLLLPCMLEDRSTTTPPQQAGSPVPAPASAPGPLPSEPRRTRLPDSPVLSSIKRALTRWSKIWAGLQQQVPGDEWARMGFYSKAYGFFRVSSLLINNDKSVDALMRMGVKCEDKLEVLNLLLLEDEREKEMRMEKEMEKMTEKEKGKGRVKKWP